MEELLPSSGTILGKPDLSSNIGSVSFTAVKNRIPHLGPGWENKEFLFGNNSNFQSLFSFFLLVLWFVFFLGGGAVIRIGARWLLSASLRRAL